MIEHDMPMSPELAEIAEDAKRMNNSSPFYRLIGMEVVQLSVGRSRIRLGAGTKHHQPVGFVHGGAIGALCDAAAALSLVVGKDPNLGGMTIELKVNYLSPVREGDLIAEGKVIHRGKRIAVTDVEVRNGENKLVAKAMGTFMIRSVVRQDFSRRSP